MRNYDGNPYAAEQGPADGETDPVTDELEAADEYISEAMGEWAAIQDEHLPEPMLLLSQARQCIKNALDTRYVELAPEPEIKPGNECRYCTNWIDVYHAEHDTCAECVAAGKPTYPFVTPTAAGQP